MLDGDEGGFLGRFDGVFIIAEVGVNHNGDVELAKRMVDAAKESGADAVKFQTFRAEDLVTRGTRTAGYQKETTGEGSQFDMIAKLVLAPEEYIDLCGYCAEKEIMFLSTPFDFSSVDLLESLDVPAFKLSSGDITNLPLLAYIAKKGRPMMISTGASTMDEVEDAVVTVREAGLDDLILLHCVSTYPAADSDVNLRAMLPLHERFKVPVGYSDHTMGIAVPIASVALGAALVEKHFTLDTSLEGPDQRLSLDPAGFRQMVDGIRKVEQSLGDGVKRPTENEGREIYLARKSLVASRPLIAGTILTREDVAIKRPQGIGMLPARYEDVMGARLTRDLAPDEGITEESVVMGATTTDPSTEDE